MLTKNAFPHATMPLADLPARLISFPDRPPCRATEAIIPTTLYWFSTSTLAGHFLADMFALFRGPQPATKGTL